MLALVKPQYITNEDGEKVSVIIPLSEYERIVQELEDIEDVQLFDEAKKSSEPPMSFDEYVKQRRAK
jgi:PHD/YefM family antitoxin component YafN of YafNO toxin-antitoxin module